MASVCIRIVLDTIFPKTEIYDWETCTADFLIENAGRALHTRTLRDISGEALFTYRDPIVREAIHALKYRRNRHVAGILGECLADKIAEECAYEKLFGGNMLIVPIPLSRERFLERGFNQSMLIAEALVAALPSGSAAVSEILVRTIDTDHQTRMRTRKERAENTRGVFSVRNQEKINGKHILLVDDVATTGATMREARTALLDAGARRVTCLAVAH